MPSNRPRTHKTAQIVSLAAGALAVVIVLGMSAAMPPASAQPSVIVTIPNGAGTSPASAPGYLPDNITVVIGVNNTVTWVNGDPAFHSVYSSTVPTGASAFHSPNLGFRDNFTQTFNVAGTYYYYCSLHSWMTGSVTVEPATASTPEFPAANLAVVLFSVIAVATVVAPHLRPRPSSPV